MMRELRRVAAPGARLLATVPAYRWLWSQHDDAHHHFRRYTLRVLRERLRDQGWETVEWSYFNTALLPPIAVVRTLGRRRPPADGRPDLKLTPPALNRLLLAPMQGEAAMIRRGARLPAGRLDRARLQGRPGQRSPPRASGSGLPRSAPSSSSRSGRSRRTAVTR